MSRMVGVGLLVLLGALQAAAQELPPPPDARIATVRLPRAALVDMDTIRQIIAAALVDAGAVCGDVRLGLRSEPARKDEIEAFGWCEKASP